MRVTFFGEIIPRCEVEPVLQTLYVFTDMPPPMIKKTEIILGLMNYFGKFSSSTAEVCKPLRKLR